MSQNQTSFKPVVDASPHIDAILADFEKYGWDMNHASFWREYVQPRDENIKQSTWAGYARRYKKRNEKNETKTVSVPSTPRKAPNMEEMQKNSIEYMMEIGTKTLQELAEDEESMKKVPIKDRLNLLKDAMKIHNDIQSLALKQKKDEREQTIFEEIMNGAQYGDIEEDEIIDGEVVEETPKQIDPPALETTKQSPHVEIIPSVSFDPAQYGIG